MVEVKETFEHHEIDDTTNELSKVTTTFVEGTTRPYDGGRLMLTQKVRDFFAPILQLFDII